MLKMRPKVSVIITTKNEEKYLERCLKAVRNQTYKNLEIVVSDACSTDSTIDIAKKYADRVVVKKTNIPQGRNFGAKFASGEVLVFLDADTILNPLWVERAVNDLNEFSMSVGRLISSERNLKASLVSLLWGSLLPLLSTILLHPYSSTPAGFAVRRDVFEKVGGYWESQVILDDVLFIMKVRKVGKIKWNPTNLTLTSMRRFEERGYLRTIFYWLKVLLKFVLLAKLPKGRY